MFNQTYSKNEVTSFVQYLLENSASVYEADIKEFKEHYESKIQGEFSVKDIKIFISLFKIYKDQMKQPKSSNGEKSLEDTQVEDESAEGENE